MPLALTLTANDPPATSVELLDTALAGKWSLLDGADFGDAVWDVAYSGPRGTLGALPADSRVQNRQVVLPLMLWPDDMDDSAAQRAEVSRVVDLMRMYGGRITFQRTEQGYRQHVVVFAGGVQATPWNVREELDGRAQIRLAFTCAPYIDGDSMAIVDEFTTDTESSYTFDIGAAGNVAVSGGSLALSSTGATVAMVRADSYPLGDQQATAVIVPGATLGSHFCGVLAKRVSADNFLYAEVSGTDLNIAKYVAGSGTFLAGTGIGTAPTGRVPYHVVLRVEGNRVYAEYWAPGNHPTLAGTATRAVTYTLTGAEIALFGEGALGHGGLILFSDQAGVVVERFEVRPYVYRGANFTGRSIPETIRLDGAIPGDAPARCEIEIGVGQGDSVAASAARFGLVAHSLRPQTHNLLPDGGFELTDSFPQWSHTAVTGVLANAGTSITRVTTAARYGAACGQVVAPATANSGARCAIYRTFRAGVTYTAEVWVRSAAGTTNARIRLGVNGDIASETAAALSSGWVRRTVTWTPTATVTLAYLVVEITAATATTFQVDGCMVYEGTTAPTVASQRDGMAGRPPFGMVEAVDRMGTNGTVDLAAGSTYLNGRRLTFSAVSTTGAIDFLLDPGVLHRDPHSPAQAVEVYLMAHCPLSTATTVVTSIGPVGNNPNVGETYTAEYGADGLTVTTGTPNNFHLFRLGTLTLPTPAAGVISPMRLRIVQTYGSNQTFHWNYLLLVPAGNRACSPTGTATLDGYPVFAQTGQTTAVVRRFTDDLQGYTQTVGTPHQITAPPLEGALITPGPGAVDFLTGFGNNAPGVNSIYGAVNGFRVGALAITPTPRWHYLRDA